MVNFKWDLQVMQLAHCLAGGRWYRHEDPLSLGKTGPVGFGSHCCITSLDCASMQPHIASGCRLPLEETWGLQKGGAGTETLKGERCLIVEGQRKRP